MHSKMTKIMSVAPPTTKVAMTRALFQGYAEPPQDSPNRKVMRPPEKRASPIQSKCLMTSPRFLLDFM